MYGIVCSHVKVCLQFLRALVISVSKARYQIIMLIVPLLCTCEITSLQLDDIRRLGFK